MECAKYVEQVKDQCGLRSDYALAECLGITQPEANLIRRGRKTPNPELCVRIAKVLGLNPVELLLVAQRDKAPKPVKSYWSMALTAVDVMSQVPKRPRYLPKKVEAIGQELRQLANQELCFDGALAHAEAVRLMQVTQRSVDSVMERWHLWRKGELFYPNYLLVNQGAVQREVTIRRLLILTKKDLKGTQSIMDGVQVMRDQKQAGVAVFYALREELEQSVTFQRLAQAFKTYGGIDEINTALFDEEVLLFSRGYQQVPLGLPKAGQSFTHIDQLQITWKPEHLHHLNPLPLFEMTRLVSPFCGEATFRRHILRWHASSKSSSNNQSSPRGRR
jgi:transcriptional regulator with XRE-family HTH domain